MADSIALLPAYASSRQLAVADPDLQVREERGGGSQKNLFPLFGPQCGLKIRGPPPPPPPPGAPALDPLLIGILCSGLE